MILLKIFFNKLLILVINARPQTHNVQLGGAPSHSATSSANNFPENYPIMYCDVYRYP